MPYIDRSLQRKYQREWVARRRAKWLADNGPCVKCGSSERLEVDHIDATSRVNHRVWSWAEPRMLEELSKCRVLCRQCYIDKTRALDQRQPVHGAYAMYEYHKCRCDLCRAWRAAKNKRFR